MSQHSSDVLYKVLRASLTGIVILSEILFGLRRLPLLSLENPPNRTKDCLRVSQHSSDVFLKHICSFMWLYVEHNVRHLCDDLTPTNKWVQLNGYRSYDLYPFYFIQTTSVVLNCYYHLRGTIILGSKNVETVTFLTDRPDNNASNSEILSSVSFLKPLILSKSV